MKADLENYSCITYHEGFQDVRLNRHVVQAAIYQYIEDKRLSKYS